MFGLGKCIRRNFTGIRSGADRREYSARENIIKLPVIINNLTFKWIFEPNHESGRYSEGLEFGGFPTDAVKMFTFPKNTNGRYLEESVKSGLTLWGVPTI